MSKAHASIAPQWGDFRFTHRLRVRWVEVDAQKVVFNGHYLTYLDTAIGDYWRAVGLPYPDALSHLQGDVYVRHHELDYHAPAQLDDWLDIGIRCAAVGRSAMTMAWAMWSQGRLLVSGQTVYVFVSLGSGAGDGRPAHIPEPMRAQLQGFEQGQAPYVLSLGDWGRQQADAAAVRRVVFIVEQRIDEAEEWDAWDAAALHAVVRNPCGLAVGTGRLMLNLADPHATPTQQPEPGHCRIGRMAVLRSARGVGLGEQVLQGLIGEARGQGMHTAHLSAQCSAQGFYAKAGFSPVGEVFDEVGIPHQAMQLAL
jgi:YbgC/YbaW family acyl-CoA thioester hydrolase